MTEIKWVDGFEIRTGCFVGGMPIGPDGCEMAVSANREGLLSLANILTELAEGAVGDHVHLDVSNALKAGSIQLILERVE